MSSIYAQYKPIIYGLMSKSHEQCHLLTTLKLFTVIPYVVNQKLRG